MGGYPGSEEWWVQYWRLCKGWELAELVGEWAFAFDLLTSIVFFKKIVGSVGLFASRLAPTFLIGVVLPGPIPCGSEPAREDGRPCDLQQWEKGDGKNGKKWEKGTREKEGKRKKGKRGRIYLREKGDGFI
jgi:hypothetical protein